MNKKYFKEQEEYYLAFFKKLPKNINIIFIKDTPIINHTESTCKAARHYNISFFNLEDNFKICDYKKEDVFKKLNKVFFMFNSLSSSYSIHYLEFLDYFCPNNSCNFYHPQKKFALLYDGSHLNYKTSIDLSNILRKKFSIIFKD